MKSIVAIKRLMEREPHGRKCDAAESSEFKRSMPRDEYDALGKQAATILGVDWEPSADAPKQ